MVGFGFGCGLRNLVRRVFDDDEDSCVGVLGSGGASAVGVVVELPAVEATSSSSSTSSHVADLLERKEENLEAFLSGNDVVDDAGEEAGVE